jgi:hypothetical protein
MSGIQAIEKLMDDLLPDAKIKEDLAQILWSEDDEDMGKVEINDDEWITIPVNCELAITTKAFFKEYYGINFGPFKVQVAIGGVEKEEFGILYAKYCFTTIYYNEETQWFSVDFYSEMR